MKITRLYYKSDEAADLERFYIRRVSGSKTIGIAITHTDRQYNYLKSNLKDAYSSTRHNPGRQIVDYREQKLSIISISKPATQQNSFPDSPSNALDNIYNYLTTNNTDDENKLAKILDVLRAYSNWWLNPLAMARYLGNSPVCTWMDEYATIFYIVGDESSYYDNQSITGNLISIEMLHQSRCCEDCDYREFDEDPLNVRYVDGNDAYVCEDCFADNYGACSDCGDSHHRDNLIYDEPRDYDYCENCYDGRSNPDNIHGYDYCPNLNFYDYQGNRIIKVPNPDKVKLPFYGAELEVECLGGGKGDYAEEMSNYGGYYEKYIYCKHDGSLNDGFEICFMPMTFHAIKNFKFYDAVLKHRGRKSLQSYNTTTCGMHIHINREAFTDHHLFKFISFVHEFKSLSYLISQRKKVGELNSYAKFNNGFKDRAKKSMVDSIKLKKRTLVEHPGSQKLHSTATYGEKYVPINLQHTNTIEVRIFKGNMAEGSFRKNFEFVDSLYYFTRENPIYKLKAKDFINYCTNEKKRYPNLNRFLANNDGRLQDILRFPLEVPEGLNY